MRFGYRVRPGRTKVKKRTKLSSPTRIAMKGEDETLVSSPTLIVYIKINILSTPKSPTNNIKFFAFLNYCFWLKSFRKIKTIFHFFKKRIA